MNNSPSAWLSKDGAVDSVQYSSEPLKLLWVLREPNGSDFDYQKFLKDPTEYNRWKSSFGLLVKSSYGILNNVINVSEIPSDPLEIFKIMRRIAVINIKKSGGSSIINKSEMAKLAKGNCDYLFNQIQSLSPNFVILGGTKDYIRVDVLDDISKISKVISVYHPNQRRIPHAKYISDLMDSFRSKN